VPVDLASDSGPQGLSGEDDGFLGGKGLDEDARMKTVGIRIERSDWFIHLGKGRAPAA